MGSMRSKTKLSPRLRGNTQTHTWTDCYNPPPTLRLMNAKPLRHHSIANDHIYNYYINLLGWHHLSFQTFQTFFHWLIGFNSTFPLTINNDAIIKAVTSSIHTTFKSLHVHFSRFTLSLHTCISHKFSSFTHF